MSDEARYAELARKDTEELQALKHALMQERSRHALAREAEGERASAPDEPEAWEQLVIAIDQILVARRGRG